MPESSFTADVLAAAKSDAEGSVARDTLAATIRKVGGPREFGKMMAATLISCRPDSPGRARLLCGFLDLMAKYPPTTAPVESDQLSANVREMLGWVLVELGGVEGFAEKIAESFYQETGFELTSPGRVALNLSFLGLMGRYGDTYLEVSPLVTEEQVDYDLALLMDMEVPSA